MSLLLGLSFTLFFLFEPDSCGLIVAIGGIQSDALCLVLQQTFLHRMKQHGIVQKHNTIIFPIMDVKKLMSQAG